MATASFTLFIPVSPCLLYVVAQMRSDISRLPQQHPRLANTDLPGCIVRQDFDCAVLSDACGQEGVDQCLSFHPNGLAVVQLAPTHPAVGDGDRRGVSLTLCAVLISIAGALSVCFVCLNAFSCSRNPFESPAAVLLFCGVAWSRIFSVAPPCCRGQPLTAVEHTVLAQRHVRCATLQSPSLTLPGSPPDFALTDPIDSALS